MSNFARTLINRIRRNNSPDRDDILLLCYELECRLEVKPSRVRKTKTRVARPNIKLREINPKSWRREYMRWWRHYGQASNGHRDADEILPYSPETNLHRRMEAAE